MARAIPTVPAGDAANADRVNTTRNVRPARKAFLHFAETSDRLPRTPPSHRTRAASYDACHGLLLLTRQMVFTGSLTARNFNSVFIVVRYHGRPSSRRRRACGHTRARTWKSESEGSPRLRRCRAEDMRIRGEASASVRAGVDSPAPVQEKSVRGGGGYPPPLQKKPARVLPAG